VEPYAVPTVHCLLPNREKQFLARRSFRRALVYGINREEILLRQLLKDMPNPAGQLTSGPFPRSRETDDPSGYAYNESVQPRPWDPLLAKTLVKVVQHQLAPPKEEPKGPAGAQAAHPAAQEAEEPKLPEVPNLILAHPPHDIARIACRSIKRHLEFIGIPITLKELPPGEPLPTGDWDLLYAELAMWDPVVDARQLLGPRGLLGGCSSHMDLALRQLDTADDWKSARARLLEVHRLAHEDAALVPLWQLTDYFAYQRGVEGIGSRPVTLYQSIENWRSPPWFATEAL
jgi:ABC-type transport system substrate-binding protein